LFFTGLMASRHTKGVNDLWACVRRVITRVVCTSQHGFCTDYWCFCPLYCMCYVCISQAGTPISGYGSLFCALFCQFISVSVLIGRIKHSGTVMCQRRMNGKPSCPSPKVVTNRFCFCVSRYRIAVC